MKFAVIAALVSAAAAQGMDLTGEATCATDADCEGEDVCCLEFTTEVAEATAYTDMHCGVATDEVTDDNGDVHTGACMVEDAGDDAASFVKVGAAALVASALYFA